MWMILFYSSLQIYQGPVLARELEEVCRLVAAGARESDLHPLAASVAAADVLARARRGSGS